MANTFKIGDIVETLTTALTPRSKGKVKYIACVDATGAGGKTCDKKKCNHSINEFVWVDWPGETKLFSYHYNDLQLVQMKSQEIITTNQNDLQTSMNILKEFYTQDKQELPEKSEIDYNLYNGFVKIKYDKAGNAYYQSISSSLATPEPLKEDQIDWDAYNGLKKGSYRK